MPGMRDCTRGCNDASVRRPFFTFLCAMSLALCAATVLLWARSYWAEDVVDWRRGHSAVEVCSARGRLQLGWLQLAASPDGYNIVMPDRSPGSSVVYTCHTPSRPLSWFWPSLTPAEGFSRRLDSPFA